MHIAIRRTGVSAGALVLAFTTTALAQPYEAVGIRAQGMAGAFVAVADDATATWWNPAGLAGGPLFGFNVERLTATEPRDVPSTGPGTRQRSLGVALAIPALGFSYYRLQVSQMAPVRPTADAQPNRQIDEATSADLGSVWVRQIGATAGQSLGEHLVIASTVKVVSAGKTASSAPAGGDLLSRADDVAVDTETHAGIDAGLMVKFGNGRMGLSARNLTEPTFGSGTSRLILERQARAGVAWLATPMAGIDSFTVDVDADLTRTATVLGDRRRAAAGVEVWLSGRRIGIRGGIGASTVGQARASASAGVTIATRWGIGLEGAATVGSDRATSGWGLGVRVAY